MRKIKVAFFADVLTENIDGAVRTMYQLINRINRDRFEFLFIYGTGPDDIKGYKSYKVPAAKLPFNKGYSLTLPGLKKDVLRSRLYDFDPEVVHIATPSILGHFALEYAEGLRIPVITIYHTHFLSYIDYYFKYAPFLIDGVKNRLAENQQQFYNRCNTVYVPSKSICKELTALNISLNKMKIWKRGIDNSMFSPTKKDPRLMQQLTGNNCPVILFASRLVWEKNLETLIAIYNGLETENVNFLIIGDGPARKECAAKMKNAIFTGAVDHQYLARLYASADVFLFPSVTEAYGNVVLEAMASGLPCVIADGGGSGDFIEQGLNGFKCEPYNAGDYIVRIKTLLSNTLLANQFANQGLMYSNTLSWVKLADEYFADLIALADIAPEKETLALLAKAI